MEEPLSAPEVSSVYEQTDVLFNKSFGNTASHNSQNSNVTILPTQTASGDIPLPLDDVVRRISTRERPTSKLNKKEFNCRKDNLGSGIASTST